MKKICLIAAAGLLAVVSCNTQMPEMAAPEMKPVTETITITAIQEGDSPTRTILDEDLIHVLWTPQDAINLFYQDKSARFESINQYENTDIAQFTGDLLVNVVTGGNEESDLETSYFFGLYPYAEDATFYEEKGYIETSLPAEQVAAKNSFADDLFITMGRSTSWSMPFYNVCSGMRFTVDQEGVSAVTLRSNDGYPLAGRFLACFDPETERPAVLDIMEPRSEIRLTPPEGDPYFYPGVTYYIVTLPGEHPSGITLELEGLNYPAHVTTSSQTTFKRSRFKSTNLTVERYYADILPLESIDLNIENDGVREYLKNVDYSGDLENYSESYIKNYVSLGVDKPSPVRFNWKSSASRTLTIYDAETNLAVYEGDASDDVTEIYNLIPGRKYMYEVQGDISWTSSFTPEGTLRMMDVDGVRNVRDLGGWKVGDKTIRYGRLYRGGQLNSITNNGSNCIQNTMGVAADIDLRGGNSNTLGLDDYYSYRVTMFQLSSLYLDAIRKIIQLLDQDKVVYFHCIYGADRTGTLAFLIEALLGVSESDLSKDFELTSFYELRTRNGSSRFSLNQMIPTIKSYQGETMEEKVTAWAVQMGLTPEEIDLLKSLMLE